MKTLRFILATGLLFTMLFGVNASNGKNERLNLPGDNLNLYAVMKLFQESETLEAFERELNAEDSYINNLDLNGDNYIDYIHVIDYVDGDNHTIVLRVAINERETQDVAVITVYKDKFGNVTLQMVGDEALYGKNYIIEPYYTSTPNPGYIGNNKTVQKENVQTETVYVQVHTWPIVRYIYLPTYVVYHSPWYWGYYPYYWKPWRAYYWDFYYGYHYNWHTYYYTYYRPANFYRYTYYNNYYFKHYRTHSVTVHTYKDAGKYNYSYSRPDLRSEGIAEYQRRVSDVGRSTNTGEISAPRRNAQVGAEPASRSSSTTGTQIGTRTTGRPSGNDAGGRQSPDVRVKQNDVQTGASRTTTRPSSSGTIEQRNETQSPQVTPRTSQPGTTAPASRETNRNVINPPYREQPGRTVITTPSEKQDVSKRANENAGRVSSGQSTKETRSSTVVTPLASKQETRSVSTQPKPQPAVKESIKNEPSGNTGRVSGAKSEGKTLTPQNSGTSKTNSDNRSSAGARGGR